jgi:hypothetical protein
MRDWVTNLSTTHYLIGSAIGPAPFPTIVRDFQSVIGTEIKAQMKEAVGRLPDAVIACVGGGSNAIGLVCGYFSSALSVDAGKEEILSHLPPTVPSTPSSRIRRSASLELRLLERVRCPLPFPPLRRLLTPIPPSTGIDTDFHSATLSKGTKGVFHGVRTYILQSKVGQILGTHSISAGLDYPGVGPEHAWLHETKRAEYVSATDEQALRGFRACTQFEGIIPALETSHAVWGTMELAKTLPKDANIVMVRRYSPLSSLPAVRGKRGMTMRGAVLTPPLFCRLFLVAVTRTSRRSPTSSRRSGLTSSTGVRLHSLLSLFLSFLTRSPSSQTSTPTPTPFKVEQRCLLQSFLPPYIQKTALYSRTFSVELE